MNRLHPECQAILLWFRVAQWASARWGSARLIITLPYKLIVTIVMGVDLSPRTPVGPRLRLLHPQGIVVHRDASLGSDVTLLHHVTIGNANDREGGRPGAPTIGDWVELGAGCVVLGAIDVGEHARVGANAVVVKTVPAWSVVVGIPAEIVRIDRESADAAPESVGH